MRGRHRRGGGPPGASSSGIRAHLPDRPDQRPSRALPRRTQVALLVLAALVMAVWFFGARPMLASLAEPAPSASTDKVADGSFRPTREQWAGIPTAPVELRRFRPEVVTDGNIAIDDNRTTPVFSPYSGRVVKIIAMPGQHVDTGAPLMAVEASELVQAQNDLITAVATLSAARAQLTLAQVVEKRQHALYLANGAALKDWQQSQADLATAQSNVRAGEIALAAVRNRLRILGKSEADIAAIESGPPGHMNPIAEVVAPISGVVTQRQVGLGEYITSGGDTPVYTIGDLSVVWLIANVREADAPRVRVGDPVEVRVLAYPGRVFNARLSWVAPAIDNNTHRLPVRADVDNPDGALKPMMFADFGIITGGAVEQPAVPQSAIVFEGDSARVWVVQKDGSLASRSIRPGTVANGMVEVLAGLAAGERVVTGGTLFIDRAARGD